ncbi:MAG: ATP-binding protein [Meiothermus sp.]|nr:ATP-binding protein [Meiothermus sp.]
MMARPLFARLWVQVALVMGLTFLTIAAGAIGFYSVYWSGVLDGASPEVQQFYRDNQPFRVVRPAADRPLRPGFLTLLVGMLVIGGVSVVVSKRLLRPLENLERSASRIASGELQIRSQPSGSGELLELMHNVNRIAERLEQAEAARRFANAAIAHELRTPLAALRSRVEGMELGVFPLEVAELGKLHTQLDVLEKLARDLQTLTLADAGEFKLEARAFDLAQLAREVLEGFQPSAQKSGVGLELDSPHSLPYFGDPERLRQVLGNLLENALRYTPSGGRVGLEVVQTGGVCIRVSDTGPGVPEDELGKLFTPFYRHEASRNRQSGGSGLGLAVVRALVEAHGGMVSAKRVETGGLVVQLDLP